MIFSAWNEFIFKKCAFERTMIIHISKSKLENYLIQKLRGNNQRVENHCFNLFRKKSLPYLNFKVNIIYIGKNLAPVFQREESADLMEDMSKR